MISIYDSNDSFVRKCSKIETYFYFCPRPYKCKGSAKCICNHNKRVKPRQIKNLIHKLKSTQFYLLVWWIPCIAVAAWHFPIFSGNNYKVFVLAVFAWIISVPAIVGHLSDSLTFIDYFWVWSIDFQQLPLVNYQLSAKIRLNVCLRSAIFYTRWCRLINAYAQNLVKKIKWLFTFKTK